MTTAILLKQAIREVIVSTPSLSTLTPRTTLSAPVVIGDTSFHIHAIASTDGSSKVRLGMRGAFYDDTGERTFTVKNVSDDGTVIDIETSAILSFTGFQHAHLTDTLVYFNIVATRGPFALPASIEAGEPLVAITVTEGIFGGGPDDPSLAYFPTYQVHVQTSRLLYRPGSRVGVDPELWNDQQEDKTIVDIETIRVALLNNQELITDHFAAIGLQFGELGSGRKIRTTHGPRNIEGTSDYHYIGVAQIVVTTNAEPLG